MSTSINIISGLGIPSQIPLNPKENISSEAALKDLGLNNNLAFTYEQGLIVYCRLEGTRYEWREVKSGEELTGLRDTDFIYPDGTITDDIDYSNKKYNFFLVTTTPSEEIVIQGGDNITINGTGTEIDPYIINSSGSPFEKINEGNGEGIIISGRDSNNYGPIGGFAVDLSTNFSSSSTKGATGEFSFVTGSNNTASQTGAVALGVNNTSSGQASFTSGNFNTASGLFSFSLGSSNISNKDYSFSLGTNITTSGNNSIGIGSYINSKSLLETVMGVFNTDYTPSSTTSWISTDRLFTIGNGLNSGAKSDALMILKNGLVTLPSITNDLIENDLTGKVIITKEYLESLPSVTPDGSETKLQAGTNITITGNGTTITPYIISSNNDDISQYTDEMAINAVATKFIDSDTISFTYDDEVPSIKADVNINSLTNSTGILKGGNLSIGSLNTLWTIQGGEGYIHNSLLNTTNHIVWSTQEDLDATYLDINVATYILIDINGELIQQPFAPTLQQLRTHIYIGKLAHTTFTEILFAITEPVRMFDIVGQISDLNFATGPININNGNVITYNGSNLNINCSAGNTYRAGANYINDRNSPSITTESSFIAGTFRRKYRNDIGGWSAMNSDTIDTNHYDDGSGILQLVPNNKWTIQVFWRFGNSGTIHVDYGQTYYNSKTEAILDINNPNIVEDPENRKDAVRRGWLVVKKGATVLNNTYIAEFFRAGKLGELLPSGNSTATLQSAYDNSLIPQIITSLDNGAFTIRRGTLFDTDNVFTIQNELGDITASITGNGYTTVSNLETTNIFLDNRIEMTANSYLAYESSTSGNIFKTTINGWESGIKIDYQSDLSNTYTARSLVDKAYVDNLLVGMLDDRGSYDASVNLFPSTGGSGIAGAILKGDMWYISVAGTLGGSSVNIGDSFRALVDTPGQTSSNWSILEGNIGYVPENVANKSTNTLLGTSNILYPTQNAVKTYIDAKITQTITNGVTTTAPSEDAVFDALALKYDASNPNGYETPSQLNTRDTNNRNRANHTGTQLLSTISDVTITSTNLNTLDDGVNTTLHFHDSDRARANHTGTQLAATISDFTTAVRTAAVQDSITDAITTIAPSQNAVYDALQLKKNATSTAITSLATLTNNGTTFTLSSFTGVIVNNTTVPAGITNVTFAGASNVTPLYLRTILYVNSSGTLVQFNGATTDLTPQQKRDNLFVGLVVYIGGTVSIVQLTPNIEYNIDNRFGDLADFIGNINQGNTISANGANLQLNKGSGFTFRRGSNYVINRAVPDVTTDVAATPIPAGVNLIGYRNGSGGWTYEAFTGSLTPTFWDNGSGTKQTVSNNKFTNQQLYFFNGTDTYVIYLGQAEYASLDAAKTAATSAAGVVVDPGTSPASLRATISIEKSCTSLLNTTLSYITQGPKISGGNSAGAGTGSQNLQSVYNNSSTPQILTSTTLGSVDLQRGSTADTDNVFRILNGAGTSTFSLKGNGDISSSGILTSTGGITLDSGLTSSSSGAVISTSSVGGSHIYINSKNNGFGARLLTTSIATSIKDFTFPNTSGTFALTSDLSSYAPLASPTFTGTPSLPTGTTGITQTAGDSSTKLATTAFVSNTVGNYVDLTSVQTISGRKNITGGLVINSGLVSSGTGAVLSSGGGDHIFINSKNASFGVNLSTNSITSATKTITFPDQSGTFALTSNPSSITATSFIKSGATAGNILLAGGTDIAQSTFATATGGTGYIQNQNASAQSANMWISGQGTFGTNIGWGGYSPLGGGGVSSTLESNNGAQIAARTGFAQLYLSSNVVGTPYSPTRAIAGYASQIVVDAFGGTIAFNRAVTSTAGSSISWTPSLTLENTGAATFSSTVTASNGQLIGGTGTSGYLPKWTGTGTHGNSLIYDNGTNVGIGTASPGDKFHVDGNIRTTNSSNNWTFKLDPSSKKLIFTENQFSTTPLALTDNVLINTTTDNGTDKLQVNGSGKFGGSIDANISGKIGFNIADSFTGNGYDTAYYGLSNNPASLAHTNLSGYYGLSFFTSGTNKLDINGAGVVKINNLSGTGTRTVVADASGNLSATALPPARPYLVYVALMSQSGTSAPTATVLENTLGGSVTFNYIGVGDYTITTSGLFTADKTAPIAACVDRFVTGVSWIDSSTIQLRTSNAGSMANGFLTRTMIEIRVYP
jgi:hypothetical protein